MNYLSFPFILGILFSISAWIGNIIGILNEGISKDSLMFRILVFFGAPILLFIWFKLVQKQNQETEKSLENYRQEELQTEDGKACQWLLNNISKINWSFGNFGMYFGVSKKYKVIIDHMCFSINGIKYQYIGSISESKILNLIELEIDYQKNKIKRNQKLEDINE
jgi:hypothetical protein